MPLRWQSKLGFDIPWPASGRLPASMTHLASVPARHSGVVDAPKTVVQSIPQVAVSD